MICLDSPSSFTVRTVARTGLGLWLAGFGVAHLSVACKAFRARVPETLEKNVPLSTDGIVVGSGIVEIGLGATLVTLPSQRRNMGLLLAAYFAAIFPGNLSQLLNHQTAFGLDTKRVVPLLFQPLFVAWSLFGGEVT